MADTYIQTDTLTVRYRGRQTNRHTDSRIHGQTDKQTLIRPTDRHKNRHTGMCV